jgi:hypothetical protein
VVEPFPDGVGQRLDLGGGEHDDLAAGLAAGSRTPWQGLTRMASCCTARLRTLRSMFTRARTVLGE